MQEQAEQGDEMAQAVAATKRARGRKPPATEKAKEMLSEEAASTTSREQPVQKEEAKVEKEAPETFVSCPLTFVYTDNLSIDLFVYTGHFVYKTMYL